MFITGSNKGEIINGTYDSLDTIYAYEGDDTVHGLYGNDYIYGGDGNDTLNGNQNNDALYGEIGNDILNGGSGMDSLYGGVGADTLNGGDGDDTFYANSLSELIGDKMNGGYGIDALNLDLSQSTGPIIFRVTDFLLTVTTNGGSFVNMERFGVTGSVFADNLVGYVLGDSLEGGNGNDRINGHNGNDTISGDNGNDILTCGQGNDFAYGGNDADTISGGLGVDYLSGGEGVDTINGDESDDLVYGDGGNDKLFGGLGNDQMSGGDGADQVFGGQGNDIMGSAYTQFLIHNDSGTEADLVDGAEGNDNITIGVNDTALGGEGLDTLRLTFQNSATGVNFVFSPALTTLTNGVKFDGFEQLEFYGGLANDFVTGGLLDDILYGGSGNDSLNGGNGDDLLSGESGNDVLTGGLGNDSFSTDDGNDKLLGEGGDDTFTVLSDSFGRDAHNGGAGIDSVYFSSFYISADIDLTNQALNDGVAKNDTFAGIESFYGTGLDDTFKGDANANRFDGGNGDDRLEGRAGNDYLVGNLGSDILTGGTGNDSFQFGFDYSDIPAPSWRADIITDFTVNQDKIILYRSDFGFNVNPFKLLKGLDPVANNAGPVMLFETDTGRLWFDPDGNDANLDRSLVVTLNGVNNINVTDFGFI